jgi:hypothetical protein
VSRVFPGLAIPLFVRHSSVEVTDLRSLPAALRVSPTSARASPNLLCPSLCVQRCLPSSNMVR